MKKFKFKTEVWLYPAEHAAWHFATVDKKISEKIKDGQQGTRRGFGSVPVEVTVGKTTWETSIFPDKGHGAYVLPIKADVRKKEGIFGGDIITLHITIR